MEAGRGGLTERVQKGQGNGGTLLLLTYVIMSKVKTWVQIQNKGEIDPIGLSLMGVSSKRGDEGKIGFFGSGNKYSIALMLREKIPFRIFSGKKEMEVTTKKVMFREKIYEQICINGEATSLTTAMGPDWEPWFAIRELYCNALDEGTATMTVAQKPTGSEGHTRIFVGLTDKLEDFFKQRERYILINEKPEATVKTHYGDVSIHPRGSEEFICFRKGIRIYPKNSKKSLYWYNFSSIEINESRTYKYEHEINERVASFFAVTMDKTLIEYYLANRKGNVEESAAWQYVHDPLSEMWHRVLKGRRVYPENLAVHSGDFEGKHNSFIVPNELANKIAEQFPDIEVVGAKGTKQYVELTMTEAEKQKIDTALTELRNIGFDIRSHIVLAQTSTDDTIAWYDKVTDTIYHTRRHLNGIQELKNTFLEEHFHAIGHNDGQREFVTFLIDELIAAKERNGVQEN